MLERYLKSAIKELDILITLTQEDITLIKEAKHDELQEKIAIKQHTLRSFESTKSLLNHELIKRSQDLEGGIEEALNNEESQLLETFKSKLMELKKVNLYYSKFVISLKEFYGTLFDKMFTFDSNGYQKTKPLPSAMLRVSA